MESNRCYIADMNFFINLLPKRLKFIKQKELISGKIIIDC